MSVVLLEAGRCGDQASGRNGGFAAASLTHGFDNGMARWPEEMAELDRLQTEWRDEIVAAVRRGALYELSLRMPPGAWTVDGVQVEQHCVYAISLAPYGDHVKRAPDLSTFRGYLRFHARIIPSSNILREVHT